LKCHSRWEEKKSLLEYEEERIDGLAASRMQNRQIADITKRSPKVFNNYLRDRKNYGKNKSSGRPKVLSERNIRAILREIRRAGESIREVMSVTKVPGSWWITWRYIKQCPNVEYTKGQRKPAWTERHLKARLGFTISHVT
jgi:DNA-binding CsgD family transcriptional regulator